MIPFSPSISLADMTVLGLNLLDVLRIVIALAAIMAFVGANAMVLVYVERKTAGFIQRRQGPYELGPQGIFQMFCDVAKLLGKQLVRPADSDPVLFWLAPVLSLLPVMLLFLPIPFSPLLTGWTPDLGLIMILAFSGLHVLAVLLAGWSSNNKFSLMGAARAVAQAVSYEIPLLLAVLALVFMLGTVNLAEIADAQGSWPWHWNAAKQPLAFFIFFISVFGETNRTPFDLAESESELTGGFHTEYSGMGFGMFFLAEYASMVLVCALTATLFLGAWKGPFFDGVWWFFFKTYALLFIMMWVRWTFPRARFDMMLNLNWRWLIPLGLFNLAATAVLMKVM